MRIHHHSLILFQPGREKKLEAVRSVGSVRPSPREKLPFERFAGATRVQEDTPMDLRVRSALNAYASHRSGAEEGANLWYGVDIYV